MSERSVRFAAVAALAALGIWGWTQPEPGPEEGIEWWSESRAARRADALALLNAARDMLPSAMAAAPAASATR